MPSAKQRARSVMGSFLQPYAVQPSGSPMSRSHSNGVRSRITPSFSAPSSQNANGWPTLASRVGKGSPFLPKHARKPVGSPCFAIARICRSWKGRTTGICRPASSAGIRSPPAADSPLSPQGAGYGNIPRGLNNTSAARLPAKSATTNTRRRRCESAGSPQYWASMSRQAVSARPPRTIPACACRWMAALWLGSDHLPAPSFPGSFRCHLFFLSPAAGVHAHRRHCHFR